MTARRKLPNRRGSVTFSFEYEGHRYRATASRYDDGALAEIFLDTGRPNTTLQVNADTAAVLTSLLLQHGVGAAEIAHSISGPIATALELAIQP